MKLDRERFLAAAMMLSAATGTAACQSPDKGQIGKESNQAPAAEGIGNPSWEGNAGALRPTNERGIVPPNREGLVVPGFNPAREGAIVAWGRRGSLSLSTETERAVTAATPCWGSTVAAPNDHPSGSARAPDSRSARSLASSASASDARSRSTVSPLFTPRPPQSCTAASMTCCAPAPGTVTKQAQRTTHRHTASTPVHCRNVDAPRIIAPW